MTKTALPAEVASPAPDRRREGPDVDLSVVVPISERKDDLVQLFEEHAATLEDLGRSFEFVFVIDGPDGDARQSLRDLQSRRSEVRVVQLHRWVGEATALAVGFARARGRSVMTLASYNQVEPAEIRKLLQELDRGDRDLVISWRHPRIDASINRWQSRVFHGVVTRLTGTAFHDVSCGLRAMTRAVADEIPLYGDLHRFFPILAFERGFRVVEVPVRQSPRDAQPRVHGPGVYLRRLLDILTLFFLFKFTKKPLRFFGLLGTAFGLSGAAITGYLGLYRILGFGGIAGRPLLILGVLLIVLGVQLFSIGLLGEILTFTHGRDRKEYTVEEYLD